MLQHFGSWSNICFASLSPSSSWLQHLDPEAHFCTLLQTTGEGMLRLSKFWIKVGAKIARWLLALLALLVTFLEPDHHHHKHNRHHNSNRHHNHNHHHHNKCHYHLNHLLHHNHKHNHNHHTISGESNQHICGKAQSEES